MELIRGIHNLRPRHRACVATIGAFDGVHRGHQAVLNALIAKGRDMGLPTTVVVFEPLPREFFAPRQAPPRLMSFREKFLALKQLGIDRILRVRFDAHCRDMDAGEFVQQVFVDGLAVKYIVVGDDLHFGHNREGDFAFLKEYGERVGFKVSDTQTLVADAQRISSSRIREALQASDFALAEQLLSRPYSITGRVILGQQLGRTLGSPTANVQLRRIQTAMSGVYAAQVRLRDGRLCNAVANVGTRPTVGDLIKAILEVHLLAFDELLYGQNIEVIFRHKIRDEQKFASLEALKTQIHSDIHAAQAFFDKA
ncbi:bifunctional riboflavin kinase/FAD synthetase [Dasania marina]|uniref:bifunctional riboflavin kinase/FAD synthetase n=1 Tax=Dasania marina TaxID=471499 RepID=UPI0003680E45|nr:bifunctional riboflavin kinase/FAD synthetase [Dasania marina]|tara:strand:+ start:121507 stop:122439 length:933 start_codon:yes stop_codon:yes gene_type:complete